MRVIAFLAVLLGLSSLSARSETASTGTTLIEFADRFDQAQLQKNRTALEQMVADDLVFINSTGQRQGKKQFIGGWTDPGDTFEPITLIDRIVTPLGADAGIVSAETVLSGTSGGKKFASRFRFTDTFRKIGSQWRAVHIQVTRIPDAR